MGKLSFDISMNTQGYVSSAKQAENANKDLEKSTKEYLESFGPLTKQFRTAKTEAKNLAGQFYQLSQAEKESEFGQKMAADLDFAIKKAAELKNISKDIDDAINRNSSDTTGIDGLTEAFGIGKSAAMGFAGAIAKVSGDSKALNGLISTLAITEGVFTTVTKLATAAQKESKIMTALQQAGVISYTKAVEVNNAVEAVSIKTTKALGMAMKALPFVAIAGAVLALGQALISFTKKSDDAADATKKQKKELTELQKSIRDISDAYINSYTSALGSTLSKYEALKRQYSTLTSRKDQIEWFKEHKKECQNLNIGINNLIDADKAFVQESDKVVAALRTRALMTAEAARNAELYSRMMKEIDSANTKAVKFNSGERINGSDIDRYGLQEGKDYKQDKSKIGVYTLTDEGARKASTEAAKKNIQTHTAEISEELERSNKRLDELAKQLQEELGSIGTSGTSGGGHTKEQLTYLQQLIDTAEKAKKKIEDLGKNATTEQINAAWKDYRKALKDVEDYKILIGIEVKEPVKEFEKTLKDAVTKATNDYKLAVINNDEAARQAAQEAYYVAQKALDDYNLSVKIEPQVDIAKVEEQKQKIQDVVNQAMTPSVKEKSFDFSLLPEGVQDEANLLLDQYKRIEDAKKQLNKVMQESTSDTEIAAAQKGLDELGVKYDELGEKLQTFDTTNDILKKQQEKWENVSEAISLAGDAMNAIGDLFGAIAGSGEDEDPNAKAMGIIFQTLATMALSFANALKSCTTWVEWLVFGVTGMAQLITMTKQVKNLTAGSYAQGGVIPGNSFSGDKLWAKVNSGERILTAEQNKNIEKIANGVYSTGINTNPNGTIVGIIRGKDLLLMQKNTNQILKKSGQNININ